MRHWKQQACVAVWRTACHNYNSNTDLRNLAVAAEFPCLRGIQWNSAGTRKFHGNGQIPRLGSKFRGSRKTVGPSDIWLQSLQSCCSKAKGGSEFSSFSQKNQLPSDEVCSCHLMWQYTHGNCYCLLTCLHQHNSLLFIKIKLKIDYTLQYVVFYSLMCIWWS